MSQKTAKAKSETESNLPGNSSENILSMGEAAQLLKTTRQSLYAWVRAGKLVGLKAGRQWRFERDEVERFLKGQEPQVALRADITPLLDDLKNQADGLGAEAVSLAQETEVQRTIAQIVRLGMAFGASHIHIHPNQDADGTTRVATLRYRVDGVLRPAAEIDIRLLPPLMEQWKLLASLDPKETQRQQERSMQIRHGDRVAEIQCQFSSSVLGESLTVSNLLPHEGLALANIGFSPEEEQKIRAAIESPSGLIVFASPSASGRTTTLYACLNHLAGPDRKIVTIEDRVERTFPWMVQLTLYVNVAMSFPFALRHFQRSDAEGIMVDYMPDKETIESAQFLAMSGRLVLAGFYANDAVSALLRMRDMGAAPHDIAEAVKLVVSQRLVRRLCKHCSKPAEFSEGEKEDLHQLMQRAGARDLQDASAEYRQAVGCDQCRGTGYQGRTAITEVLEVTQPIKDALKIGASDEEFRQIARSQMTPLAANGIARAIRGETSVSEVKRVLGIN